MSCELLKGVVGLVIGELGAAWPVCCASLCLDGPIHLGPTWTTAMGQLMRLQWLNPVGWDKHLMCALSYEVSARISCMVMQLVDYLPLTSMEVPCRVPALIMEDTPS